MSMRRWIEACISCIKTVQAVRGSPAPSPQTATGVRVSAADSIKAPRHLHLRQSLLIISRCRQVQGKVRDTYDAGDFLVIVTTDRQSAFGELQRRAGAVQWRSRATWASAERGMGPVGYERTRVWLCRPASRRTVSPRDHIEALRLCRFADRLLASVPFKGQVLNQTAEWWFKQTGARAVSLHLPCAAASPSLLHDTKTPPRLSSAPPPPLQSPSSRTRSSRARTRTWP